MGLRDWLGRRRPASTKARPAFQNIDPADAQALQAAGARVVDVRSRPEFERSHIPGAWLLPLDQLQRDRSLLPAAGPLIFVCEIGGRSAQAADLAAAAGRTDIFNLAGGMRAWRAAGLPTEP
jgi:rhodanese-related sulfurtransferase